MSSNSKPTIVDAYLEVRYVTIEGAGGSTRVYMSSLIDWLKEHPGTLIVGLYDTSARPSS